MLDPGEAAAGEDRRGQGVGDEVRAYVVGEPPVGQTVRGEVDNGRQVAERPYFAFGATAVKSRPIRSGALAAAWPAARTCRTESFMRTT